MNWLNIKIMCMFWESMSESLHDQTPGYEGHEALMPTGVCPKVWWCCCTNCSKKKAKKTPWQSLVWTPNFRRSLSYPKKRTICPELVKIKLKTIQSFLIRGSDKLFQPFDPELFKRPGCSDMHALTCNELLLGHRNQQGHTAAQWRRSGWEHQKWLVHHGPAKTGRQGDE